ncbi:MAG: cobalamin B12-binding domain-containing protein [Thermoleophilia bacterium]|nr:cobalamin B12-binding domain-containing protein [Thermoleophilia bacterium]
MTWLARVLAARDFPLERLARDLELAADVVAERLPRRAAALAPRLEEAGSLVRALADEQADAPVGPAGRLAKAYVAAIVAGRPAIARATVERAVEEGMPVAEAYVGVLQPALYEIGDLWAAGRVSVAQEHLATATTQVLAARLAARLPRAERGSGTVVVAASEGELHALGTRFVAELLEAAGWTVLELGASTPVLDLVTLVARERPRAVGLSTSLTTNLRAAEEAFARLRALPAAPLLAAGGRAYGGDAELARRLGADFFAPDPLALLARLREHAG